MGKIITIGMCPSWDFVCKVNGINWGQHKQIKAADCYPAGKALNISRALAWMKVRTVAAGLWGKNDFSQMVEIIKSYGKEINVKFTEVAGSTRQNITIIDCQKGREMHLRSPSKLATKMSLRRLGKDLQRLVNKGDICVFAGAMGDSGLVAEVVRLLRLCRKKGAKIVVDSSGKVFKAAVEEGGIALIKPNVTELQELVGLKVKDNINDLTEAAMGLLDKVGMVLVSRGKNGAVVVSKKGIFEGRYKGRKKALSTVACGDYLLAGFLTGLREENNLAEALKVGLTAATAKALGMAGRKWEEILREIKIEIKPIKMPFDFA